MTVGMIWHSIKLRREKPFLTYTSTTQEFSLPRPGMRFPGDRVEGFVVLDKSRQEQRPCLELRIRTRSFGARRLLRVDTRGQLQPIIRLIESETGLSVLDGRSVAKV